MEIEGRRGGGGDDGVGGSYSSLLSSEARTPREKDGTRGLWVGNRGAVAAAEDEEPALERVVTSSFHCWRKRDSSDSSAIVRLELGLEVC